MNRCQRLSGNSQVILPAPTPPPPQKEEGTVCRTKDLWGAKGTDCQCCGQQTQPLKRIQPMYTIEEHTLRTTKVLRQIGCMQCEAFKKKCCIPHPLSRPRQNHRVQEYRVRIIVQKLQLKTFYFKQVNVGNKRRKILLIPNPNAKFKKGHHTKGNLKKLLFCKFFKNNFSLVLFFSILSSDLE